MDDIFEKNGPGFGRQHQRLRVLAYATAYTLKGIMQRGNLVGAVAGTDLYRLQCRNADCRGQQRNIIGRIYGLIALRKEEGDADHENRSGRSDGSAFKG